MTSYFTQSITSLSEPEVNASVNQHGAGELGVSSEQHASAMGSTSLDGKSTGSGVDPVVKQEGVHTAAEPEADAEDDAYTNAPYVASGPSGPRPDLELLIGFGKNSYGRFSLFGIFERSTGAELSSFVVSWF